MQKIIISVGNLLDDFYKEDNYHKKVVVGLYRDVYNFYKPQLFSNPTAAAVEQLKDDVFEVDAYLYEFLDRTVDVKDIAGVKLLAGTVFAMLSGLCDYLLSKVEERDGKQD